MKVRDYGDCALLLECGGTAQALAWAHAVHRADLPGVLDIVPAATTVLCKLAAPRYLGTVKHRVEQLTVDPRAVDPAPPTQPDVTIAVHYDGTDLGDVCRHTGLQADAVIAAHTGQMWRVGFSGFAPGFGYLIGGDPRLQVPRRAEPRTRVPAGAVALAGLYCGIYPRESPGGWQLIGHTDAVLWDLKRPEPALLRPGLWVQFTSA